MSTIYNVIGCTREQFFIILWNNAKYISKKEYDVKTNIENYDHYDPKIYNDDYESYESCKKYKNDLMPFNDAHKLIRNNTSFGLVSGKNLEISFDAFPYMEMHNYSARNGFDATDNCICEYNKLLKNKSRRKSLSKISITQKCINNLRRLFHACTVSKKSKLSKIVAVIN